MLVTHRLTCPDRPQSKKSSLKNQPPERKLSYERIQVGDTVYRIKGSDGTTPLMHAELNCRSGDHSAVAITDESIQVSLICPIGKKRMKFPGRSTNCTHAQCFDLATFIEINKRSHDKMKCPLCGVQIDGHLFWMEVYIDTLMTKILVEADGDKVLLTKDGWKVQKRAPVETEQSFWTNLPPSSTFLEHQQNILTVAPPNPQAPVTRTTGVVTNALLFHFVFPNSLKKYTK